VENCDRPIDEIIDIRMFMTTGSFSNFRIIRHLKDFQFVVNVRKCIIRL